MRRILLAVTGLTPQVVTETLFALMREGPDSLPHAIRVLTTSEGAERARLAGRWMNTTIRPSCALIAAQSPSNPSRAKAR